MSTIQPKVTRSIVPTPSDANQSAKPQPTKAKQSNPSTGTWPSSTAQQSAGGDKVTGRIGGGSLNLDAAASSDRLAATAPAKPQALPTMNAAEKAAVAKAETAVSAAMELSATTTNFQTGMQALATAQRTLIGADTAYLKRVAPKATTDLTKKPLSTLFWNQMVAVQTSRIATDTAALKGAKTSAQKAAINKRLQKFAVDLSQYRNAAKNWG